MKKRKEPAGDLRQRMIEEMQLRRYSERMLVWIRAMLCLLRGVPVPDAPEPEDPGPPPRCPRCDAPMEPRERTWRPIPSAAQPLTASARGPPADS